MKLTLLFLCCATLAIAGCGGSSTTTQSTTVATTATTPPGTILLSIAPVGQDATTTKVQTKTWTVCGTPTAAAPTWPDPDSCTRFETNKELTAPLTVETKDLATIDLPYSVTLQSDKGEIVFQSKMSGTRVKRWDGVQRALGLDAWRQIMLQLQTTS